MLVIRKLFVTILALKMLEGISRFCQNYTFSRPQSPHSVRDLMLTKLNRCNNYPRCLLFDCCSPKLLRIVQPYFASQSCRSTSIYSCMLRNNCDYNQSLSERVSNVLTYGAVITDEMLEEELYKLPPTPPAIYTKISRRSVFKVLYLVQGDIRRNIDMVFNQIAHERLYLSYEQRKDADLYYPGSTYAQGRMALYLTARLLEIQQGWLYDYYVFVDDDADWIGHVSNFVSELRYWEPAVGAPRLIRYTFPSKDVIATDNTEPYLLAYHREAVEVLHPWILDFDRECFSASSHIHRMEIAAIYRNHFLLFGEEPEFRVTDKKLPLGALPRPMPRNCSLEIVNNTLSGVLLAQIDHIAALPPTLKHCAPSNLSHVGEWAGVPHRKEAVHYHLMNGVLGHFVAYAQFNQTRTCATMDSYNPYHSWCCTVDLGVKVGVFEADHRFVLPDKSHYSLIPANGTIFDIPNIEEVFGCGKNWQSQYTQLHKILVASTTKEFSPRQLVGVATTHGLSDELQGIITELYFAILTKRAIRLTTYSAAPDLNDVFYSPHIEWAANEVDYPAIVYEPMKFAEKGRGLMPVWCKGRGRFHKRVDPKEYAQLCLTNKEEEAEQIYVNTSYQEMSSYNTAVLLVASNRGRSYALFKENKFMTSELSKFDMKVPESCFLCGFLFLFRPKKEVVEIARPTWNALTADPKSITLGIKIRIGDKVFEDSHQQQGAALGRELHDTAYVKNHFGCAKELELSLQQLANERGYSIRWLLIADSRPLRIAAKQIYGDKLIVDTEMTPMHSNCEINKIGTCSNATVSHALRLAASDILSFSLADYHIFTEESGFGRVGAWLSSAHANKPRRHIFNLKTGVPRSCAANDADDFLVDSRKWAGI